MRERKKFCSLDSNCNCQVVRDAVEEELAAIETLMNERKSFYHVDPSKFTNGNYAGSITHTNSESI